MFTFICILIDIFVFMKDMACSCSYVLYACISCGVKSRWSPVYSFISKSHAIQRVIFYMNTNECISSSVVRWNHVYSLKFIHMQESYVVWLWHMNEYTWFICKSRATYAVHMNESWPICIWMNTHDSYARVICGMTLAWIKFVHMQESCHTWSPYEWVMSHMNMNDYI